MRRRLIYFAVSAMGMVCAGTAVASEPLQTAIVDGSAFSSPSAGQAFSRVRAAGASVVRLTLYWRSVAPDERSDLLDPSDPLDPGYQWGDFDRQVSLAVTAGLDPIVTLQSAPAWAEGSGTGPPGTVRPDPAQLGAFARAAAERFSGRSGSLPRVRFWQVWNEPNISLFLRPQFVAGVPFSPAWYRRMVNEVARSVKSVSSDNVVIVGGTAPFRDITPDVVEVNARWGPLTFMREFLCLAKSLKSKCGAKARFDVWAHHPYTSGGPTHHAVLPDDVSLGDLAEMRRVLVAGYRSGNIISPRLPRFWITEVSWDSKPPDPKGVPTGLHTRWTAELLYRAWKSGVTLVTWFLLRDEPLASSFYQSGLYHRSSSFSRDRPKPALRAFRFPLVAIPEDQRVHVWGRTPGGRTARVLIEKSFRGGWMRLGVVNANQHGIFERRFQTPAVGTVRARTLDRGETAVPFGVRPVPDRRFNPFGSISLEP